MIAPRLEINLDKLEHNARTLVRRLKVRGINVTGVTKGVLGSPEIANVLLSSGVRRIGDSRIENIESMRRARIAAPMTLVRSPMLSQVVRTVGCADISFNTELIVIRALSSAATKANRTHGIVLMVELGDLREGIMPNNLESTVRETLRLPNIALKGIGTNLACRSGVSPDAANMAELSACADKIEATFRRKLEIVSGGNSANINWVFGGSGTGRINELRLGESILLGREALYRQPIEGLFTDAFTLVAEVIESQIKPTKARGTILQNAFGETVRASDRGDIFQTIFAIGRQDTDPRGLTPPPEIEILDASSDHLITDSGRRTLRIGAEVKFQPDYSALLRAMSSSFVAKIMKKRVDPTLASKLD